MRGRAPTAWAILCVLTVAGACALAGCAGSPSEPAPPSGRAIESHIHAEEASEARREEVAEAARTRELLSEIEAEQGEAGVEAAKAKAKRIEAAAKARAKKLERAAEARVNKLEAAAKSKQEAVTAKIKREREALSKTKQQIEANTPPGTGSGATTPAAAPQATGTQQTGATR